MISFLRQICVFMIAGRMLFLFQGGRKYEKICRLMMELMLLCFIVGKLFPSVEDFLKDDAAYGGEIFSQEELEALVVDAMGEEGQWMAEQETDGENVQKSGGQEAGSWSTQNDMEGNRLSGEEDNDQSSEEDNLSGAEDKDKISEEDNLSGEEDNGLSSEKYKEASGLQEIDIPQVSIPAVEIR